MCERNRVLLDAGVNVRERLPTEKPVCRQGQIGFHMRFGVGRGGKMVSFSSFGFGFQPTQYNTYTTTSLFPKHSVEICARPFKEPMTSVCSS